MALGIGANATLFSVLNGVLFRSVANDQVQSAAALTRVEKGTGRVLVECSEDELRAVLLAGSKVFDKPVIYDPLVAAITTEHRTEIVSGELVNGPYFSVVGARADTGRLLGPVDDEASANEIPAVISERLRRRLFGADADVIGKPLVIAHQQVVVVGVLNPSFHGLWLPTILASDIWLPIWSERQMITVQGLADRTQHRTIVTLQHGATLAQADAVAQSIGKSFYSSDLTILRALPSRFGMIPQDLDKYGALLGSAALGLSGLVFLVACANLFNLTLIKNAERLGEMAIRSALGASKRRLFQVLLSETFLLTTVAGLVGIALTWLLASILGRVVIPSVEGISIAFDPSPDMRVMVYGTLVACVGCAAVGVLPAISGARVDSAGVLAANNTMLTDVPRGRRVRGSFVALQVAVSMPLVLSACLIAQTILVAFATAKHVDTQNRIVGSINFGFEKTSEAEGTRAVDQVLAASAAVPGVQATAFSTAAPLLDTGRTVRVSDSDSLSRVNAHWVAVSPSFFEAVGIGVLEGRRFNDEDAIASPSVAIVNRRLAEILWPHADAVGHRLEVDTQEHSLEVVGISADSPTSVFDNTAQPMVYVSFRQFFSSRGVLIARVISDKVTPDSVEAAARAAVPGIPMYDLETLDTAVNSRISPFVIGATVVGALAIIAIVVAMCGVYSTVAYSVSRRRMEVALRKVLGATEPSIILLMLRDSTVALCVGIVGGAALSVAAWYLLAHVIFKVAALSPGLGLVAAVTVIVGGFGASILPAIRATRLAPSVALRRAN